MCLHVLVDGEEEHCMLKLESMRAHVMSVTRDLDDYVDKMMSRAERE